MDKKTQEQITSFTNAYQKMIDNVDKIGSAKGLDDYWGYYNRWLKRDKKTGAYSREEIDKILDSADLYAINS